MKKTYSLIIPLVTLLLATSCITQKELSYFNEVNQYAADSINKKVVFTQQAIISVGDRLGISVSAENPKAVAVYNLPFISYTTTNSEQLYSAPTLQTYIVDIDGNIDFPQFGKIHVDGMTRKELVDLLTSKISVYVKKPIVNVQFFDFTVTVLGEVTRPGKYPIINERTTILDALGLAGDITVYGKKNNVLIAREINGEIKFKRINFNSDEIFTSPYYYVKQNDVIIVEPNGIRAINTLNIPLFVSSLSALTSIATTVAILVNQNNK